MWLANRKRKQTLTTIVLHATAGSSLSGALSALNSKGLSYHYLIEKNGKVTKCVSDELVAFHAGVSLGPNGPNVNNYSIGISFVNTNTGHDPYTDAQIKSCELLVRALKSKYPSLQFITTHAIISPKRKTDPKGFPIGDFAKLCALGLWNG